MVGFKLFISKELLNIILIKYCSLYKYISNIFKKYFVINDFITQVMQLLKAEFKELVDVARATIELVELCDKK